MIWLILLGYVALATYIARSMPANDFERDYLGLDTALMQADYQHDFGLPMPARKPWRLPGEYYVYAWAKHQTHALWQGRAAAIAVSSLGLWLTMQYAQALGGRGIVAGLIVLTSPYLVSQLTAASYKAPIATLWVGGLYALHTGHPLVAMACGATLALLRATSWGMALWLLWASGGIVLASGLAAYLWLQHREVVLSQGWTRLLRGQSCPVQGIPRDGWGYALRTLARRYEGWGVWLVGALVVGRWHHSFDTVLMTSVGVFVLTHLPRALIRPKWVIGYMAEWMLPVAVEIGVMLK